MLIAFVIEKLTQLLSLGDDYVQALRGGSGVSDFVGQFSPLFGHHVLII